MNKVVAATMAALLLAGCATTETKVDPATVASFQPGVTTIAQVEAALGQPFQATRLPDGRQQLQYVSKRQEVSGDGMPTGSQIPKHVEKTVSTVLSFDKDGRFVSASSDSKTKDNKQWPSNLGSLGGGDVQRQGQ
jgi:outer membrane protein assembly factor BamE (lipoprotein component of BamABCDE complex)